MSYRHVVYSTGFTVDLSRTDEILKLGVEQGLISVEQKEKTPQAAIGLLMTHSKWIQQFTLKDPEAIKLAKGKSNALAASMAKEKV